MARDEQAKVGIAAAVLCDTVREGDLGKKDAHGVFSRFRAWGFPCQRSATILLVAYGPSTGQSTITIEAKRRRQADWRIVGTITATWTQEERLAAVIHAPVHFEFRKPGDYVLRARPLGSPRAFELQFRVDAEPWPELAPADLEKFRKRAGSIPRLQAVVNCPQCQTAYIFQEAFTGEPLAQGSRPFPASGVLDCESCDTPIAVRDLQGQLRDSFRQLVEQVGRQA